MNKSNKIDNLVKIGILKSFSIENLDINGNIGVSDYRNTERLTLIFPNDEKLILDTFCSGCSENTAIIIS